MAEASTLRRIVLPVAGRVALFPELHGFAKADLLLLRDDNFKHKRCPG